MEKTELKLQQGCAKTKERQMSDDKLMGRRRKRRSRKRRRRRKWELICKKHVQRYRNRQHCPKMNKSGKWAQVGLLEHWCAQEEHPYWPLATSG